MRAINKTRFFLGAVIAAIVLFLISGVVNGAILGADWSAWQQSLGTLNHAPSPLVGMLIWIVVSVVYGVAGMWIYAGIRGFYGPGPKTAVLAGFILWLAGSLTTMLSHLALDDIPQRIALINAIAFLIGDPLAIVAGAAPYKDASGA
jgi:hypothetical protein